MNCIAGNYSEKRTDKNNRKSLQSDSSLIISMLRKDRVGLVYSVNDAPILIQSTWFFAGAHTNHILYDLDKKLTCLVLRDLAGTQLPIALKYNILCIAR